MTEHGADGSRGPQEHKASEELLFALANRSAALQFLKLYELSIRDIDQSIEWGYPKEQLFKLLERRGKCLAHLGKKAEAIDTFKKGIQCLGQAKLDDKGLAMWLQAFDKQINLAKDLTEEQVKKRQMAIKKAFPLPKVRGGQNDKLECMSNKVELVMTQRRGREIIAKEEVRIGDIISLENPYAAILYSSVSDSFCYNCMKKTKAPLPCHSCSALGFCSISCQREAWAKYHHVECKYMAWLSDFWTTKLGHLALRITLTTPYETLKQYFGTNKAQNTKSDIESGFSEDGVYHSNYISLFNLVTNGDLRLPDSFITFGTMALVVLKIVKGNVEYWNEARDLGDTPEESDLTVATSLMHHIQLVQCNAFGLSAMKISQDFRECQPMDIGLGVYTTMSLLNHSCDPNIELTYYGQNCVAVATRDIKPGEPLLNYYSMSYYTNPKKERQMYIQMQFYFDCQCEACVNDWPLWEAVECRVPVLLCGHCGGDMPTVQPVVIDCPSCKESQDMGEVLYRLQMSHELFSMAMKDTLQWRHDAALPVLEEHLRMMQTYIKRPWRDFISCQATLKQIYNITSYLYDAN